MFHGRTNFQHWIPYVPTFLDMLAKRNFKRRQHLADRPKRWGQRPHFVSVGPRPCGTSSPHVIFFVTILFWTYWRYAWILIHMMLFCHPIFLKWYSWNSLVISIHLLYLEWNVGILAVNICILWLPTPPTHTLRVLLVPEQKKRIKSWRHKQELLCYSCSRIKNTTYNSYLGSMDVSKS
jgi:hypothetical protein